MAIPASGIQSLAVAAEATEKMNKKIYEKPSHSQVLSVGLDALMPVIRERLDAGQSVTIYPRGVSMLPTLKEGRDNVTLTAYKPPLKRYEIALFQRF